MILGLSKLNVLRVLTVCAVLGSGALAQAQPSFPSKAITIIVPATPGGILDQTSRLVASELTKLVNQPVLVENKAGAGQIIGVQALARAEPDGHTMVMGSIGPNAANYSIYPKLPYAPGDFTAVAHVVSMPNVVLINPAVKADTLAELIALAKAKPGGLTLGSSGTATSGHLAAEMLKMRAGIDLVHVPYKGATPALTDLVGGQVQVMVDNLITALPLIKAGKVKALAVTSTQRIAELPSVPTVAESGFPGFEVVVWVGLLVPSKTPPAVVDTLHSEVTRVLAMPQVKKRIADMGGWTSPMTPAQFNAFIRSEIDKWSAVVKQAGIKAE
ncbi:MAG TPA: tripartite tricarboxylate transporter substrate binding protein [Burkholderiaceae bacterium]|jgi:tripartite-type tricarboxylate transporter receptor subunit TctC|nr:tripartite tricarboxylate transporter substrate binding protein [Burkholderiaceae bacterium]